MARNESLNPFLSDTSHHPLGNVISDSSPFPFVIMEKIIIKTINKQVEKVTKKERLRLLNAIKPCDNKSLNKLFCLTIFLLIFFVTIIFIMTQSYITKKEIIVTEPLFITEENITLSLLEKIFFERKTGCYYLEGYTHCVWTDKKQVWIQQ